jgi:hypothetical protein
MIRHEGAWRSDLGTSWRWAVSFTLRPLYSCIHWIGGWVGSGDTLDDVKKRTFLLLPGLELRPLGRPARSQPLYRLSYPGSYIRMVAMWRRWRWDEEWIRNLKTRSSLPSVVSRHIHSLPGLGGKKGCILLGPRRTHKPWNRHVVTLRYPQTLSYSLLLSVLGSISHILSLPLSSPPTPFLLYIHIFVWNRVQNVA